MIWHAYRTVPNDTKTFGAVATIISSLRVPYDLIYAATKAVFKNFEEIKKFHVAFGNMTKEKIIHEGIQMVMRGGAVKYFRKAGLRLSDCARGLRSHGIFDFVINGTA